MKYNVIGDIHGRTCWKELVQDDRVNIFVGDYFDPYENYMFNQLRDNFLDIIEYKKKHPETILLLGNHDAHYIYGQESTRYMRCCENEIRELLEIHKDLLQLAFATDNYLITHAGVTDVWIKQRFPNLKEYCPKTIASVINSAWDEKKYEYFMFGYNCMRGDFYGTSSTHSCIWVRSETLIKHNVFQDTEYKQIVGHTQHKNIIEEQGVIIVDVLGTITKSYQFEN